ATAPPGRRPHLLPGRRYEGFGTRSCGCSVRGQAGVSRQQVGFGLAAHDHACAAVGDGDDSGTGEVVVVARQGEAVGAGCGDREPGPRADIGGQVFSVDDDVAALAVLADHPGERGRGIRLPVRDACRIVGTVEGGAGVVAHAAVDADVATHG